MHSPAFVVLIHNLRPTYRPSDFWTAASRHNLYGFYLNLKFVSFQSCHASFKWRLHLYLLMLTFVYHRHFISGMGTMVMWPSCAVSRCSSLQQRLSCCKKRFMSDPLPVPDGLQEPQEAQDEFQSRYSIDCSSLDLLKLCSTLQS